MGDPHTMTRVEDKNSVFLIENIVRDYITIERKKGNRNNKAAKRPTTTPSSKHKTTKPDENRPADHQNRIVKYTNTRNSQPLRLHIEPIYATA
jgi:hypothetical protein